MIFIIAFSLVVLGFILASCENKTVEKRGSILFCTGVIFSLILVFIFVGNYLPANREYIQKQEEYKALVYKAENINSQDEFNLNGKAIIDEIYEWNEEIRDKQYLTNNIWVGIFWPEFWNELELIDYNIYQRS